MKRIVRISWLILAHLILIGLIVVLLLANWMPAIYSSNWFKQKFSPAPATTQP
ncbi:MAG: hypothetical protein IT448_00660 [Phycisphaerales bacterium]|nr:hypothetical protein [Phycisphaerales bacterium]